MNDLHRRGWLAIWPLLLSGCTGSLLPKPPAAAARFTLDTADAASVRAASAPASGQVILVAAPTAAPGYDTVHMVYVRQAQQLQAYAFHEWVKPPAQMLAPLLVRALQATAAFRAVLAAPSSGKAALRLETGLLWLRQDHSVQPSQLRMAVQAVLLDAGTREVLGSQLFELSAPTASDDAPGGVAAAQAVAQTLATQVASACRTWAAAVPRRQ